ncbi:MAG: hypothetical protein H7X97_08420 [Opitutaceae bacterium]|nr:hypothetical protein [Verrucomicrobiales bacterium]
MMNRKGFTVLSLVGGGLFLFLVGCSPDSSQDQLAGGKVVPKHEHVAPHGGTAIELGDEEFHLELVLDRATGRLKAYVLDGHLENFVRITPASFEIEAKTVGGEWSLVFKAVPNQSTGEKVGDTSMFESTAEWLKSVESFEGKLKELEIKGKRFAGVAFNFPKGNEASNRK